MGANVAESFFHYPLVNAFVVAAVAFLMVSKVPTYSFKRLRVRREYILPVLIVVGLLAAVLYLASIPLSMRGYRRRAASASEGVSVEELSNALPEEEEIGD